MSFEICSPVSIETLKVLALAIPAMWALFLFGKSQQLQRAQIYKDMEFKAVDLFVMAVNEPMLNRIYETDPENIAALSEDERRKLRDYAYCVLNLFELMFNLQERRLITRKIFSSWVTWYFEFSRGAFSRNLWKEEAARHYSSKFGDAMRKIMNEAQTLRQVYPILAEMRLMKRDDPHSAAYVRRRRAKLLAKKWRQMRSRLSENHAGRSGREKRPLGQYDGKVMDFSELHLGWASPARQAKEYVDFFLRNTDPSFISFGEIIDGRADGPEHWSSQLPVVLTKETEEALVQNTASENHTRLFEARDRDDSLLGYALVSIDKAAKHPNAWLQDVIVDSHVRGRNLGTAMVEAIESELGRDDLLQHIFLESSTTKTNAHRFFRRLGYHEVAVVMMKSLR